MSAALSAVLDVEPIEEALIAALRLALPELKVEPCPEDPDAFTPSHLRGHVLVSWGGADWPAAQAGEIASAPDRCAFDIQVFTKSLRTVGGHYGAYEAMRRVSAALDGDTPGSGLQLGPFVFRPDSARFQIRKGGYWGYGTRTIGVANHSLRLP